MCKHISIFILIVLIRAQLLQAQESLLCHTPPSTQPVDDVKTQASARMVAKTIKVHFDIDNSIFLHFGKSINDTRAYAEYLFRNVQKIFQVDAIDVQLGGTYIWTQPDLFNGSAPNAVVTGAYAPYMRNNFNADVTVLLTADRFGGYAFTVFGLCNQSNFAVCGLQLVNQNEFPTYNYDVALVAHEMGHLLGSNHTFECAWISGNNFAVAIDNCGPPSTGCTPGPPPSNGGTIMGTTCFDYSLSNGFGPLPTERILGYLSQSPCVQDASFYQSTLLDSAIIWTECRLGVAPDQSDYKALARGIVYGNPTSRFKAKVVRFGNPAVVLDSLVNLQYNVQQDLGSWFNKTDSLVSLLLIDQTVPNYEYKEKIYVSPSTCVYASSDLSLSATTPTPTPAQWTPFSVTYTLTNSGAASQNIRVEVPEVVGAVYVGGNVAQASSGTFDGIKVWAVPALGTGQSATLMLNYFNTSTTPKVYFGQVTAMSGSDLDSSPGNNNTGIPNEDDEVRITINGTTQPTACQITAATSGILCNNNGTTSITTDDTWSFSLSVSGSNTGTLGWLTTINGQTITGNYGTPVTVQGGLISAGSRTFTVSDRNTATCTANMTVAPPAPCSTVQPSGPCASKSDFPWHEWIAEVQVGTIIAPSAKSAYSDNRTTVFDAQVGSTAVALTTEFSYFAYAEHFKIWIDLNNDGALTDATETVYQGQLAQPANGNARHRITGNMTIPAGTYTGNRLMRISMKRGSFPTPCETLPFGEVEDYSVRIIGANLTCQIAAQVSNLLCNNVGTTAISTDDTYSFALTVSGTNTGTTGWQATINGQTVTGSYGTATTVQGGLISAGVRTFAVNDRTTATCTTQVIVTPPAPCSSVTPQPCTSAGIFPWHEWIARVQIGAFDYASGKSTYSDFTSAIAQVVRGQATSVTLTAGYSYFTHNEHFKIWADWNRDGAFDDATEAIFQGIATAPANGTTTKTVSGSFSTPVTAATGDYRIRVSMKRGSYPTPCESIPNGEVEEYGLRVNATQVLQNSTPTTPHTTEPIATTEEPISIYPNPATDRVTVRWQDGRQENLVARVSLVTATGAPAAPVIEAISAAEIDLSRLANGLYFVRVEVAGQRAAVRRVVVMRE
jgi:GEVED domain/Metallo-peptidase family M12/Secretion system C-terminal sorting domain